MSELEDLQRLEKLKKLQRSLELYFDAFADMCNLRCKPDTQAETRVVAQQIDRKMIELFPVSWKALVHDNKESGNGC